MMDLQQKNQITEAVNKWLDPENPERSANKLATKAGISAAYISKIKNGEYNVGTSPISDASFIKLANALGLALRGEEGDLHWETYNFKMIQQVCRSAQKKKKIVILDSEDSGVGKTYGLEYYNTYNDKVLYIKCTSSMGAKDLLDEILRKLRIHTKLVGKKAKLDAIKDKLMVSPGYLIIIDEAEDVSIGIYKLIKEIIDFLYNRIGVVVSGMRLIDKINTLANKGRQGFPQLRRRLFANKAKVQPLSRTEIVEICQAHAIKQQSAHNWFIQNVTDFQMLSEYIKDCTELAKKEKKTIDADFLTELFNPF